MFPRPSLACCLLLGSLALALTVAARGADDLPPFKHGEYRPAALGPREPKLNVDFPSAAGVRGIAHGFATVAVLVDADGKPLDFLVTSETDDAFGRALVAELETLAYQPATLRGAPIPARCGFTYEFQAGGTLNVLNASESRSTLGQPKPVRVAVAEGKLDHKLEIVAGAVPVLPPGVGPGKPVKVLVTFFVDETGQVRVPNVESSPLPEVIAPAIAALSTWKFQPPTVGGKPAIVFVTRRIPLNPATR
jgi:outer membrane biosynthesis protein TonB